MLEQHELPIMDRHTKCGECKTRYNAIDNDDCPYCTFPNLSGVQ